jgi:hypothetical protein
MDVKMVSRVEGSGMGAIDWIYLAQDRYRWRALVNAVTSFRDS